MSIAIALAVAATMLATSFLSGVFGMAGGLILIGVLLALMPVPDAMALHAVTQVASNGWRSVLWIKFVRWRAVAVYLVGCALALAIWSVWRYVPSRPVAVLALGATPFLARMLPEGMKPDPEKFSHGAIYGCASMTLMLLTGVAGPLIDTYFLGGKLDRKQIVATKAICQIFGHSAKLVYFGGVIDQAASLDTWLAGVGVVASMAGNSLARPVLERLSDKQYRAWAGRIITAIAAFYLLQGMWLMAMARA